MVTDNAGDIISMPSVHSAVWELIIDNVHINRMGTTNITVVGLSLGWNALTPNALGG